jgi:hypothetical protein
VADHFRILPVLTLLFLCSFLDRTNVGNAKTYDLETDLGMTDHQYDTGLAVYYATYIARYVSKAHPRTRHENSVKPFIGGDRADQH